MYKFAMDYWKSSMMWLPPWNKFTQNTLNFNLHSLKRCSFMWEPKYCPHFQCGVNS